MLTLVVLVVSFGICREANIVNNMSNTTRDFVDARRHGRHDRDASVGYASRRDAPPHTSWVPSTTTAGTYRSRAGIR